ncbi:holin family protein [uncultured Paraglaciecola sp.]|uniref:holin family protein n=1 Tax=uncultured Paraglaciecola sp. TaxID=1765024 RepID=UPI00262E1473|nr:holin family protein [uncultured Paraglaciecola sp.]
MSFDPISALFDVGKTAIERIWPDPIKRAEEIRKLEALKQTGDLAQLSAHVQIMTGQMNINAKEAEHKSIFVAGWRPFIGWVGGFALGYQFVFYPMLLWFWQLFAVFIDIPAGVKPPPVLDGAELYTIVLGMLGIGAMRSFDKKNGTATHSINGPQ